MIYKPVNNFKFPDVSFWQDDPTTIVPIDFDQMAKNTEGVIIRAGQGTFEDKVFKTSWKNAKAAGLLRGAYWFYDSRVDAKRQAEKFVSVLGNDLGEMEMWCDYEDRYGGPHGGWKNWYNFMVRIQQLLPNKQLGIYTGYYYWTEFGSSSEWFGKFPLWQAWYNTDIPPIVPKPWKTWTFHQFTDDAPGAIYGVESREIDLNYFNGSVEEFLARYHKQPSVKPYILTVKYDTTLVEYQRR